MNPIVLCIVIVLGLLLIPLLLKWLQEILPLLRARLAGALPSIADWMRRAFRWAGRLVTDDGELSLLQSVEQVVGATVMIAMLVVFTLCDLKFAWATLCPMFGGKCGGEVFAGFDQLLSLSAILLAAGFGLVITDLCGLTYTTHFARSERMRLGALCMTVLCFFLSLGVVVAMGYYRYLVMTMGETAAPVGETAALLQNLQMIILVLLPALLFIGTAVTVTSLKTFAATVGALLMVVGGVTLGTVWLILGAIDLLAEVALAAVTTVPEATGQVTKSIQEGVHSAGDRVKRGSGAFFTKVRDSLDRLVQPAAPKRPMIPPKGDGFNASETPSRNLEAPAAVKPPAEEPGQQPHTNGHDAHA